MVNSLGDPSLLPLNFQAVYRSGIEARYANEEVLPKRLKGSERGMALVSWDVVCQATSQGGLKVLHLNAYAPQLC